MTEENTTLQAAELNAAVKRWDLLESNFYKAWSAGTLPMKGLVAYAQEYGAFISMLSEGWTTQDDAETADEETEHAELWEEFAEALGTSVGEAKIPAVQELIRIGHELFANRATAIGALYAFEVQQPATAQSKLEGLRAHYKLGEKVEPYFITHSHNEHEAEKLLGRFADLSASEQKQAVQACETMARALREALDGMYDAECGECKTMN